MKKITLYAVSKCPPGSPWEVFIKNLCAIVADKKQISEYLLSKIIVENWSHYCNWLELHYSVPCDTIKTRNKYIADVFSDRNIFGDYSVKKYKYTLAEVASIFRVMNHCTPVGTSYETELELKASLQFVEAMLKQ